MTLDMESPLFVRTKKLAPVSPPPRQNSSPSHQAPNSRISFSITDILRPDFGSTGSEPRTVRSEKEAKLSPVSHVPASAPKDALQSYYQLYQQRYAQYMLTHGLGLQHGKLESPQTVVPPFISLPPPVAPGLYPPQHFTPHHPHFPAPPPSLHHPQLSPQSPLQPHHPSIYRAAQSPPQPLPPKRAPSPPPTLPQKTVDPPRRKTAPAPTSPPSRPKERSAPGVEDKQDGEKDGDGNMMWPAWVYCTRYSDRPSAGPRSRKIRRRDKISNPSAADEKRPRTAFTNDQLEFLRCEFEENKYLTEERRQRLAKHLDLTESQIKIWFQNKRAKLKKSSGGKNSLTLSLIAQGLYNHTPSANDDSSSQTSDAAKSDSVASHH